MAALALYHLLSSIVILRTPWTKYIDWVTNFPYDERVSILFEQLNLPRSTTKHGFRRVSGHLCLNRAYSDTHVFEVITLARYRPVTSAPWNYPKFEVHTQSLLLSDKNFIHDVSGIHGTVIAICWNRKKWGNAGSRMPCCNMSCCAILRTNYTLLSSVSQHLREYLCPGILVLVSSAEIQRDHPEKKRLLEHVLRIISACLNRMLRIVCLYVLQPRSVQFRVCSGLHRSFHCSNVCNVRIWQPGFGRNT